MRIAHLMLGLFAACYAAGLCAIAFHNADRSFGLWLAFTVMGSGVGAAAGRLLAKAAVGEIEAANELEG